MSRINDRRQSKHKPFGFVVATDSFMSGWGDAQGGKSYYAIAVDSRHESDVVEANMRSRSEMKRVRFNLALPKLGPKDHLSIVDRHYAQRFFEPGGFAQDASPKKNTETRQHLETIRPHVELYRDPRTGIAWIENGSTGTGHSCHPNISGLGSAAGMIRSGRWDKGDKFVRSHGFLYNVSHCITSGELDKIACKACRCGGAHGCAGSPRRGQRHAHSRQTGGNALGSLAHKAASKVAKLFTSKKGR